MALRTADERPPQLQKLQDEEEKSRKHLKQMIIESAEYDGKPAEELIDFSDRFVEACADFDNKSQALVGYHTKHGQVQEGNAFRKLRYRVLYKEAQEAVNFLNEWLRASNQNPIDDLMSVISHPSLFTTKSVQKSLAQNFVDLNIGDDPPEGSRADLNFPPDAAALHEKRDTHQSVPIINSSNVAGKPTIRNNDIYHEGNDQSDSNLNHAEIGPNAAEMNQRFTSRSLPPQINVAQVPQNAHNAPQLPPIFHNIPNANQTHPMQRNAQIPPTRQVNHNAHVRSTRLGPPYQQTFPVNLQGHQVGMGQHPHNFQDFAGIENYPNLQQHNYQLDSASQHRLRCELLGGLGDPFGGKPEFYVQWHSTLSRRISECASQCDSLDIINIIMANTSGDVKDLVKRLLSAGINDPDHTLQRIWTTIAERYGSSEGVSDSVLEQMRSLRSVVNVYDIRGMHKVLDTCYIVESFMLNYPELRVYNTKAGLTEVLNILPEKIRTLWYSKRFTHKENTGLEPDFSVFVDFLAYQCRFFSAQAPRATQITFKAPKQSSNAAYNKPFLKANATKLDGHQISEQNKPKTSETCLYHGFPGHLIHECKSFEYKNYDYRKRFATENNLCYICLQADCKSTQCERRAHIKCRVCNLPHATGMHKGAIHKYVTGDKPRGGRAGGRGDRQTNWRQASGDNDLRDAGGAPAASAAEHTTDGNKGGFTRQYEEGGKYGPVAHNKANCMSVCNDAGKFTVCSKTLVVDIAHKYSPRVLRALCILDEQSNGSFCDEKLIEHFKAEPIQEDYVLSTMNGTMSVKGFSVPDLMVKGAQESRYFDLPPLLTHPAIPDTRDEVATAGIIRKHTHLRSFASYFPDEVSNFDVVLLLGANCGELMKSNSYGDHAPYIHQTPLGYTVVGPVCESQGQAMKTLRTTIRPTDMTSLCHVRRTFVPSYSKVSLSSPFETREDDSLPGNSQEDSLFMDIIMNGIHVNDKGNIEMPLPLKPGAPIPENKWVMYHRTLNMLNKLKREPSRLKSCLKVFGEYVEAGHVEPEAQPAVRGAKENFLPIFSVYNEAKDKTRLVFDSSAAVRGVSLNSALLQGPDEGCKLLGVLMRFRIGQIGFSADIQKMFHSFYVSEEHRAYMKFWWFKNNDPKEDLTIWRANVMVFGNTASPACCHQGLRYAAKSELAKEKPMSAKLLLNNIYVDDCLGSSNTVEEAVETLSGSIQILGKFNIRLHKLNSSSQEVLQQFPESEWASAELEIKPEEDARVLGMRWSPDKDTLSICSKVPVRPFTKRGLLAMIHGVFDPLGMADPCVLPGKLLQREIMPPKKDLTPELETLDWDDELPPKFLPKWNRWIETLQEIDTLHIPRCHQPRGFGDVIRYELHCFVDASKDSIGYIIYLRSFNEVGNIAVAFISASSKVAPRAAETIPRLELCAAMFGAIATMKVARELGLPINSVHFYTDSFIVLGYLRNTSQRFSRYVARRVEEILGLSQVSQWSHISGSENVGDIATRPHSPAELKDTAWLLGPSFLREGKNTPSAELVLTPELPEVRGVKNLKTSITRQDENIVTRVSNYTNSWKKAIFQVSLLVRLCRKLLKFEPLDFPLEAERSKVLILTEAQKVFAPQIVRLLLSKGGLSPHNKLAPLSPYVDLQGILRVGGRLRNADFSPDAIHPVLLPKSHHVTDMIILFFHESVSHQGRVLTHGAIRNAGYHVLHGSRVIKDILSKCVFCKRLRGKTQNQIMADLPEDRVVERTAAFTTVGLDMAGPFSIHDGRNTRRTSSTKKVWILLITCLTSRAIHVEVVSSMDTSSFILALRRFIAIRGTCSKIYSDCGSNFIGAINNMIEIERVQKYVATNHNIAWVLNPPKGSNYGGVFERKIGSWKAVFNSTVRLMGKHILSREEFHTLVQEAASVVNGTPLWEVSSHPEDPAPLCPSNLLTLKDHPNPPSIDTFSEADIFQYGKKRWRRILYLSEQFWLRWRSHYLLDFQERNRWTKVNRSIKEGDLVLVKGQAKRNCWPMGRIIETIVSTDGLVRRVKIKVSNKGECPKILERSVRDTVLLSHSG